jgi:hypothetical protein
MSDRCFLIDTPLASIVRTGFILYLHEHGCQFAPETAGRMNPTDSG